MKKNIFKKILCTATATISLGSSAIMANPPAEPVTQFATGIHMSNVVRDFYKDLLGTPLTEANIAAVLEGYNKSLTAHKAFNPDAKNMILTRIKRLKHISKELTQKLSEGENVREICARRLQYIEVRAMSKRSRSTDTGYKLDDFVVPDGEEDEEEDVIKPATKRKRLTREEDRPKTKKRH